MDITIRVATFGHLKLQQSNCKIAGKHGTELKKSLSKKTLK
jgi:hypothetical protein